MIHFSSAAQRQGKENPIISGDRLTPPAGLKSNSVGFGTVLMQSVAQIAPAIGILTTIAFNTRETGLAAPVAYLVAFVLAIMAAISLAELGRHLPSAGGFFTYVSSTVGPQSGFLVGWLYSWFVSIMPGGLMAYTAYVLQVEVLLHFGIRVPWPLVTIVALSLVAAIGYRGIKISGRALTIFSIAEMLVVVALAVSGIVSPGPGPVSLAAMVPPGIGNWHGFFLATVLSIFAFTGWEGAAAIAEEARNPRTAIPRAIISSVMVLGAYYVLCSWGIQLGWGTSRVAHMPDIAENPAFVVAQRLWGRGWILVLLALLNSCLAVCTACTVDSSRNWFAMARAGVVPAWLGRIHPVHRTPHAAILMQMILAIGFGLGLGLLSAPDQAFFTLGTLGTIVYVFVYAAGNLGVMRFFLGRGRAKLNVVIHLAFPVLSTIALVLVLYFSLVPLPDPPISYAPWIAAVLLCAGLVVLGRLRRRPDSEWKDLSVYVIDAPKVP